MADIALPALPITGGCLCKAVRYSVSSTPIAARQCWCRDCQYFAAGSSTVNVIFNAADVSLTGELKTFVSKADSGNTMTRGFCPSCGTPVTSASSARPEMIILRAGTLDHTGSVTRLMNIWISSAPHWAHLDPAIPSTPAQPAPPPAVR
jgi:hypothetical protein